MQYMQHGRFNESCLHHESCLLLVKFFSPTPYYPAAVTDRDMHLTDLLIAFDLHTPHVCNTLEASLLFILNVGSVLLFLNRFESE